MHTETIDAGGALSRGLTFDHEVRDVCGRRRSPATFREFHEGRKPRNKGQRYPAEAPTIAEIVAVTKACPDTVSGDRLRALIILLWRSGLRISEALDLRENDLNERENSIFVRNGKGGKSRVVGMDDFGWQEIRPWMELRRDLPIGTVFPIVVGPTTGLRWSQSGVRIVMREVAHRSGIRRRFHPHCLRHAHACELAREGVPLHLIQRQLGHANPGITAIYLQSIAGVEVLDAISARKAPMVPAM